MYKEIEDEISFRCIQDPRICACFLTRPPVEPALLKIIFSLKGPDILLDSRVDHEVSWTQSYSLA